MNEWERGKCSEAQETSQGYLPVLSSPTGFRNAQHATLMAPSIPCLLLVMSGKDLALSLEVVFKQLGIYPEESPVLLQSPHP